MQLAQKHQDYLPNIKKYVKQDYSFFKDNRARYNEFRRFVFKTSLSDGDEAVLDATGKPQLEFNILEAYISRLRGEFSKQEPSIKVMAEDGAPINMQTINVVEGHCRHIIGEANKDGCEYNVYTDQLSGGYSVLKVWTEYANPKSFNQVIKVARAFDPLLCGFDPMARTPHKGDGRFCFELYPKTKDEFEEEYPDIDLREINFTRTLNEFNWSYSDGDEDILLICDFYEKKKKRKKIAELANDKVILSDDYEQFCNQWNESGAMEQVPAIISTRWTELETICRYRCIENQVLEYTETDYRYLPLIFVDGNSITLRENENGNFVQFTRPYVYQAKGIQKLKNFAGQSLGNELENMVQHKIMICKESLPDEQPFLDAYTNLQVANTLVYKAYMDNRPEVALPPPIMVERPQIPPEITNTFSLTDQVTQAILGSYDASLGINNNQLSGVAIVEGATQSNSAAMPYVVGFLQAWNQVANIIVDLIPKYYVNARSISIVGMDGKSTTQNINQQGGVSVNYDENALNVKVEAGVNFAIQKSRALQQIIAMMQASPLFAQFMNQQGLEVLLDNLEIRGIDQLKSMAAEFQQQMQQQQQQTQQQQQNTPQMIQAQTDRMKFQYQMQKDQQDQQLQVAQMNIDKQNSDNDMVKIMADVKSSDVDAAVAMQKADAEKARATAELAMKAIDMHHGHTMDVHQFAHQVKQDNRVQPTGE